MSSNQYFCNNNRWRHILLIILLTMLHCNRPANSRPSPAESSMIGAMGTEGPVDPNEYYGNLSLETIRKIKKCEHDIETMDLCMRCAKVTKSEIVYPMCCDNEDETKDWCRAYVYYG